MSDNNGMNALGKPIPKHRKDNAKEFIESLYTCNTSLTILLRAAEHALEHDRPNDFFKLFKDKLDLTAIYRLMAIYLTA